MTAKALSLFAILALTLAPVARADVRTETKAGEKNAAFDHFKQLEGEWIGTEKGKDGHEIHAKYEAAPGRCGGFFLGRGPTPMGQVEGHGPKCHGDEAGSFAIGISIPYPRPEQKLKATKVELTFENQTYSDFLVEISF